MDRDRDRRPDERDRPPFRGRDFNRGFDRDERDRDGNVERLGRGESYRPNRSPPPRDSPRDMGGYGRRPPPSDTYIPGGRPPPFRPRSRSPPLRRSPPNFRRRSRSRGGFDNRGPPPNRPRSRTPPSRRGFSPRREDSRRRDQGPQRSPLRPERFRSPASLKRSREPSPYSQRAARSFGGGSPPNKRERFDSLSRNGSRAPIRRAHSPPPRDIEMADRPPRRRSPSPRPVLREDRDSYSARRPRSPSPMRPSGPVSTATSRRSSPRRPFSDDAPSRKSTPDRERGNNGPPPSGPRGGASFSSSSRPPPTGPASGNSRPFASPAGPPPTGPAQRTSNAPFAPRGRGGPRGGFPSSITRDFSGPPSGPRRGSEFDRPAYPTSMSISTSARPGDAPPLGPRSSSSTSNNIRGGHAPSGPAHSSSQGNFRSSFSSHSSGPPPLHSTNNSTSTTYPRTQRFNPHLADTSQILPGGKLHKSSTLDPAREQKLSKLEEEAAKLRQEIAMKQKVAQREVREWDRLAAEAEKAGVRAQYAEESIGVLELEPIEI